MIYSVNISHVYEAFQILAHPHSHPDLIRDADGFLRACDHEELSILIASQIYQLIEENTLRLQLLIHLKVLIMENWNGRVTSDGYLYSFSHETKQFLKEKILIFHNYNWKVEIVEQILIFICSKDFPLNYPTLSNSIPAFFHKILRQPCLQNNLQPFLQEQLPYLRLIQKIILSCSYKGNVSSSQYSYFMEIVKLGALVQEKIEAETSTGMSMREQKGVSENLWDFSCLFDSILINSLRFVKREQDTVEKILQKIMKKLENLLAETQNCIQPLQKTILNLSNLQQTHPEIFSPISIPFMNTVIKIILFLPPSNPLFQIAMICMLRALSTVLYDTNNMMLMDSHSERCAQVLTVEVRRNIIHKLSEIKYHDSDMENQEEGFDDGYDEDDEDDEDDDNFDFEENNYEISQLATMTVKMVRRKFGEFI